MKGRGSVVKFNVDWGIYEEDAQRKVSFDHLDYE